MDESHGYTGMALNEPVNVLFQARDLLVILKPVDQGRVTAGCEPDLAQEDRHLLTKPYGRFGPSFLRGCTRRRQLVK